MENLSENCQMIELPKLHPSAYNWLYNSCTILSLAEFVREDDFLTPPNTPLVPPNSPTEGIRPKTTTARSYATCSSWETSSNSKTKERSSWLEPLARKCTEDRISSERGSKRHKVRDEIAAWELWRTRMLAFRAPDPPFLFPLRMHPLPPPFENRSTSRQRGRMSPPGSYYTRNFSRSFSSTNSPFLTQTRHDRRSNSIVASPRTHRRSSIDTMRTLGNVESLKSESKTLAFNPNPESTNDLMGRSFHWKERPSDRLSRSKWQGGDSDATKRTLSSFQEAAHSKRKKRMLAQWRGSGDAGKVGRTSCLDEYIALFKNSMLLDRSHGSPGERSPQERYSPKDSDGTVAPPPSCEKRYRKTSVNRSLSRIRERESAKNILAKRSTGATIVLHKNHDFKEQSEVTKSRCTITYAKTEDDPLQNLSLFQRTKSTSFLDTHSIETAYLADTSTFNTSDPILKRKQAIVMKNTQYQDGLMDERKPVNKHLFPTCLKRPVKGPKLVSYSCRTWPHPPLDENKRQKTTKKNEPTENIPERVENKTIKTLLHQPLVEDGANVDADESASTLCSRRGRRNKDSALAFTPNKAKLVPQDSETSLQSVITLKRKKLNKTKDSEPPKQAPTKCKEAIGRQTPIGSKRCENRNLVTSRLLKKKTETYGKSPPRGNLRFSLKDYHLRKFHATEALSEKGKAGSDTSDGKDSLKKRLRALNIDKSTTILPKLPTEGVLPTFLSESLNELGKREKQEKTIGACTLVGSLSRKEESVSSKTDTSDRMKTDSSLPNQHSTLINYIHHHIKMNSSPKDSNDLLSKLQTAIQKDPLRPGFEGARLRSHDWQWNEELIYKSPDEVSDMSYMSEYFRKRQSLKQRKGLEQKRADSDSEREIQVHDLLTKVASSQQKGDANAPTTALKAQVRPGSSGSDIVKTVSTPVDNARDLRHLIIPEDEEDEKVGDTMEKFKNIHKLKSNESGNNLWKVLQEGCIGNPLKFPSRTITTIKESSDDLMKSLYMSDDTTNIFSDNDNSLEVGAKVGYWPEKNYEDVPLECPKHKPSRPFYWPNDPRRQTGSQRYGINIEETHPQFNTCMRSGTDLSLISDLPEDTSKQIVMGSNYTDTVNLTEDTTDLSLSFTFSDSSSMHRMDSAFEQTEVDTLTELNDASRIQTQSSITGGGTQVSIDLTETCPIETLALTRSKILLPSRPPNPTLPPKDLDKEEVASKKSEATAADVDELKKACSHATHESNESRSGLLLDDGQWKFLPSPISPPPSPIPPSELVASAERLRAIKSMSQEWQLDFGRKSDSPKAFQGNVPGIRYSIFGGKRININDQSFDAPYSQQLREFQRKKASRPKIPQHILRHLKKSVAEKNKMNVGVNKFTIKRPSTSTPKASTTAVGDPPREESAAESGDKSSAPSSPPEAQPVVRTSAHGIAFPSTIVVRGLRKGSDQSHTPDAQVTPGVSEARLPSSQEDVPVTHKKRPLRKARVQMHDPMEEEPPGDGVCLMGMTLPQRMSLINQMCSIATPFSSTVTCLEDEPISPEVKKLRLDDKSLMRPATCPDKYPEDTRPMHDTWQCANMQYSAIINVREPHKKVGGKGSNILEQPHVPPQPAKYRSFPGAMGASRNRFLDRAFSPLSMIPEASACQDQPKSSGSARFPRTTPHSKNVSRQERRVSSGGTEKPTTATSEIIITEEGTLSSTSLTNARFSMFSNGNQYWPDGSRSECMDGNWQLQQYRKATEKAWKMIAQGKQQAQQKSEASRHKEAMAAKFLSINHRPASCIEYLKRRLEEEEKRLHHLTARRKRLSLLDSSPSPSHSTSFFSAHRNPPSTPTGTTSHSGSGFQVLPLTTVTPTPC